MEDGTTPRVVDLHMLKAVEEITFITPRIQRLCDIFYDNDIAHYCMSGKLKGSKTAVKTITKKERESMRNEFGDIF